MESCPIPIEVCESIMDAAGEIDYGRDRQDILRRCALTFRTWRPRAQLLLWRDPWLCGPTSINIFIEATRHASEILTSHIRSLHIVHSHSNTHGSEPLARLNAMLLTPKISHLRTLKLQLDDTFPSLKLLQPRILRLRPPLLSGVTTLHLVQCQFPSPRSMLDMIWACPNLSALVLWEATCYFGGTPLTEAEAQSLSLTREQLGACSKLKTLHIVFSHQDVSDSQAYALYNVNSGSILSTDVAHLEFTVDVDQTHRFTHFLPGIFNTLTSLRIELHPISGDNVLDPQFSVLHMLAERLAAPTTLQKIIIKYDSEAFEKFIHTAVGCHYCETMIGRFKEDKREWENPLFGRFCSLQELCLDISKIHIKSCAAHVVSTLPSLRGILRFRYWVHDTATLVYRYFPYAVPQPTDAPFSHLL
ncbi:hypothetical protein BC628DRAFT_1396290 [Trametes gibbosa]|nr:hypothetical protein BC628DRAFT_1396290 [Trametes gibbosa]